jgi:DNA invertase Pin-like site-specific DNA recombinase
MDTTRVIAYIRVSTQEQDEAGNGLAAQEGAIRRECEYRRWELVEVYKDVASGKSTNGRTGFKAALADMEHHRADVLMGAKLDRVTRSTIDFGTTLEKARKQGWALNVLDLGLDMSTSTGELVAGVLVQVAQFERRRIGERTKEALAVVAQTKRLGRPRQISAQTEGYIQWRRSKGASLREIAAELDDQGTAPPKGGRWQASTIQRVLTRQEAASA